MKHCKFCNADVSTNEDFCPLCYNKLINAQKSEECEFFYQQFSHSESVHGKNRRKNLVKSAIFAAFCAGVIALSVNAATGFGTLWFPAVLFGLTFILWIVVISAYRDVFSTFIKSAVLLLTGLGTLYCIAKLTSVRWFYTIAFPTVSIVYALASMIFAAKGRGNAEVWQTSEKRRGSESVSALSLVTLVLGAVSIALCFVFSDGFFVLSAIAATFCCVSALGIWTFCFEKIIDELGKKWHL